jgi:hypothetical protein
MPRTVVAALDADAAFVHGTVMKATQGDEVGQFRLASSRPMMNVMAVDVPLMRAAGEDTPFVT